jgi:hypothetical protein
MPNSLWTRVEEVLMANYHNPDIEAARALYSAFAAHRLSGAPVWPMIVAPPGSLKTEMLNALEGQKGTHLIDQITPNTFISGQIQRAGVTPKDPPGLLHRLGSDGVIIFSDFSTILSMPTERRAGILADMRRIYDGSLRKEFGTAAKAKSREWKGRITFLVAATPEVDRHYSIFQSLGERFVMIRCPRPEGQEAALAAMRQNTSQARQELKQAVHSLLGTLTPIEPMIPEGILKNLGALAEFVVHARTHIPRDGYQKAIRYVPEAEAPTRLGQQLAQLSKGSALLDGRYAVGDSDFELVLRVAMDCIPTARRRVLEYLTTGDESKLVGMPGSTRSYAQEELHALGLIEANSEGLSLKSLGLLTDAGFCFF